MTNTLEDLDTLVISLTDEEAFLIYDAIQHGPLVCSYPSNTLLHVYLGMCAAEERPAVIVRTGAGSLWGVIVAVENLDWLPHVIRSLVDSGVEVERVRLDCGLVHALVPKDRVEAVVKAVAPYRIGRLTWQSSN